MRRVSRKDVESGRQQLHPRALSRNSDVEGARLVRSSGVGAQSVVEGAHEEATRLRMAATPRVYDRITR